MPKNVNAVAQVEEWFDYFKRRTDRDVLSASLLTLATATVGGRGLPAPPQGRLLTVAEVAEQLNVSKRTIYQLCESGRLPSQRIGPTGRGVVRIDPDDLRRARHELAKEAERTADNRRPATLADFDRHRPKSRRLKKD